MHSHIDWLTQLQAAGQLAIATSGTTTDLLTGKLIKFLHIQTGNKLHCFPSSLKPPPEITISGYIDK